MFADGSAVAGLTFFALGPGTRAPRGTRTRRTFGPALPEALRLDSPFAPPEALG